MKNIRFKKTPQRFANNSAIWMKYAGSFAFRITRNVGKESLTLRLLTLYIYGAPCKARNFKVVYI
jgi:hypothetical protein